MLGWLGYGAAARVSGKGNDAGRARPAEAFAFAVESSYRPGQLLAIAGEMPPAKWDAACATSDAGVGDVVEGVVEVAEIAARGSFASCHNAWLSIVSIVVK
jgi:hypothetical protein